MKSTFILTDTKNKIYEKEFFCSSEKNKNCSVKKFTLEGGQANGMDIIEVNNGALSFTVLPTRGMGILRGEYKGLTLGWDSPVCGPVHPAFVNLDTESGLGWLAGFDELIVRCGLQSNGAPGPDIVRHNDGKVHEKFLPLHGRIANIPAHFVAVEIEEIEDGTTKIAVVGEVDESMLFMPHLRLKTRIETTADSNSVKIIDEVVNCGTAEEEIELLYHCNFGPPFLEGGSKVVAPVVEVAPRDEVAVPGAEDYFLCAAPEAGFEEKVYFYELAANEKGNTLAMLQNSSADKAVALRFNKNELPWFTLWKNTAAEKDGYVVGLEPGTDFPNNRSIERARGRLVKIKGGGVYKAELEIEAFDNAADVKRTAEEISEIQKNIVPVVYKEPKKEF